MTGRYLTDMADVLRAAGVQVVEVPGWQTRARGSGGYASGRPTCIMWHHTASRIGTSAASNVGYIIKGAPAAPLANIYLHPDGVWHVCAAGATNTNGAGNAQNMSKGTVPDNAMNVYAIGIEAGNNGIGEPWPRVMIDSYFQGSNALAAAYGLQPTDICSHNRYSPQRKIDPAQADMVLGPWKPRSVNGDTGSWNLDDMRAEAQRRATPPKPEPEPLPPGDEDVEVCEVKVTDANARFLGHRVKQTTRAKDGTVAERTFVLWMEWVNGADQLQLTRYETYQNMGVPVQELAIADCKGVGLIGPVPTGDGLREWSRADFGNVI